MCSWTGDSSGLYYGFFCVPLFETLRVMSRVQGLENAIVSVNCCTSVGSTG